MTEPTPAAEPKITIDDFRKVQMRVARVLEASNHPNADKLLVLKVDLGSEQRTLCAGIRQWYPDPSVLVGKSVIVVVNLAPRPMRGVESNGMMLAASGGGDVVPLTLMKDLPPGSAVS